MGYGVAVDATGVYMTGSTGSGAASTTVFPTTSGAYDTSYGGGTAQDVFVTKFNLTGTALIYSTYIGAAEQDTGQAIAVDSSGVAYIAGVASTGFPTTAGAYDTTYNLGQDGFVAKLSADGAQLLYSTFLGSPSGDALTGIAIDAAGAAYVTGSTGAAGYPVTPDADDSDFGTGTNSEAVLTKINPAGLGAADLVYSTLIGRTGAETSRGPALDGANVWVVGSTGSADFPTTAGAWDTVLGGTSDGFVMKFVFAPPPDTDPPETTIVTGPSNPWPSSSATFTFSADEVGSTFECNFDGAGFSACSTPVTYSGLTPGAHTFGVRAIDPASNVDPTPATTEFRVAFPSFPGAITLSTTWSLRDSLTTGPATIAPFTYGTRPLVPFMGDWNGDGVKTPGTFEGGVFKLRNSNSAGTPDVTFSFGDPRGFVVAGDFNGDGTDDVGVFRAGLWQLRIPGPAPPARSSSVRAPGRRPFPWSATGTATGSTASVPTPTAPVRGACATPPTPAPPTSPSPTRPEPGPTPWSATGTVTWSPRWA
jgi:hypothetical protein